MLCGNDGLLKEHLEKLVPSKILEATDLDWIPRNNNPVGQSNSYLCIVASELMVGRLGTHLIGDPEVKLHNMTILTVNTIEAFSYNIEKEPTCLFCCDLGVNTTIEPVLTWPPKEDPEQKYEFTQAELKTYEKELKRVVDNAIDDFVKKIKTKEISKQPEENDGKDVPTEGK